MGKATLLAIGVLIAGSVAGVALMATGHVVIGTAAVGSAFVAAIGVWIVKATSI